MDQSEGERYRKIENQNKELILRIMSIVTEDERRDIPPEVAHILGSTHGDWSPATVHSAIKLVKDFIGEPHYTRLHIAHKWVTHWHANPQIHF